MQGLKGKVALVTGAASGIGRCIAERLAAEGCDLGLLDLDEKRALELADSLAASGAKVAVAAADVSDPRAVSVGVGLLREQVGGFEVLVNSAGILRIGSIVQSSLADWRDMYRVNVEGTLNLCQAVVPGMIERRSGRVINLSSWLGKAGMRNYGGYCASKFAVLGLTRTLALEVAEHGITVNAVCPGTIIDTGMREEAEEVHRRLGLPSAEERKANVPLGRLGLPRDVAGVVAFLASEEADYVTGQSLNVCGGLWMQ